MTEQVAQEIFDEIDQIPALPRAASQVMQLTRDPDCSADRLSHVISADQGLTANLLKLCNSAFYGLPRTIGSVKQAIMYLGFHTVRTLVLTSSLFDMFRNQPGGYGFEPGGGLWKHSLATALSAQLLARRIQPALTETAFTAGLLHDLGKLVLIRRFRDSYFTVEERVIREGIPLTAAERDVIGYDHAFVGGKIADRWAFPRDLSAAIALHHEPARMKGFSPLVVTTHLGNVIARRNGFGIEGQTFPADLSPPALEVVDMREDDLDEFGAKLNTALEQASEFV
jgi:putative nucleotidyltransferase with HDIG domain